MSQKTDTTTFIQWILGVAAILVVLNYVLPKFGPTLPPPPEASDIIQPMEDAAERIVREGV